jgi:septal ring factor EnvC (AmiA/AmiB activator)
MRLSSRLFSVPILAIIFGLVAVPAHADVNPHERLKQHIRDIVKSVKAAPTAAKKRSILDEKLRNLVKALNRAEEMETLSPQDQSAIDALRAQLREKINELNGLNGYEAVPDHQLDSFANYVQQDFEQADRVVTISLTSALLIILLIILVA